MTYQKELTDLLDNASKLYYQGKTSPLTDTEFDLKLKELQSLEKQNKHTFPNSPTLRVGSDLRSEFKKIEHPKGFPMLTIENVYTDSELEEWMNKMFSKHNVQKFNMSLKYDGISCELHYKDGMLVSGATRGDKLVGDDITDNVRTIKSIPLSIPYNKGDYFVRGEILLPKSRLIEINRERENNGDSIFANCRNACSGSVKQLDSRITASRGLIFRPWDIVTLETDFPSQTAKNAFFTGCGFEIDKQTHSQIIIATDDWQSDVKNFWEIAKKQDYDCDGIVIKIDNTDIQKQIGTKDNRAIEWGVARKWNEENIVNTTLKEVQWLVGRTGHITPVGILEPVACDGVTISNVTLNNLSFIRELDLHIGSRIRLTRSGGVIPYVLGKEEGFDDCRLPNIEAPIFCPDCGNILSFDGEYLKCTNKDYCQSQIEGRIEQWCSKDCMDIPHVGPKLIHALVEKDLISHPLDLYSLPENYSAKELAVIMGIKEGVTSMYKLLTNIKTSRARTFDKVLYGLSIEGIGKQNAKVLAEHFGSYAAIREASKEELMSIDGIGEALANSIIGWFETYDGDHRFWTWLYQSGLQTEMNVQTSVAQENQILEGLNIVFSGKSNNWDGDEVEEVFTSFGAKCGHSISKKTNYLVTGENPGPSKMAKAKTLGVEIISEADFIKKYNIPTDKEFVFPTDLETVEEQNNDVEALW